VISEQIYREEWRVVKREGREGRRFLGLFRNREGGEPWREEGMEREEREGIMQLSATLPNSLANYEMRMCFRACQASVFFLGICRARAQSIS